MERIKKKSIAEKSVAKKTKEIKIGIVDDHAVLRQGLSMLISDFNKKRKDKYVYNVIINVGNGAELIKLLETKVLPDVVLLDTHMPIMDGYKTAGVLQKEYPSIKVLTFTEFENENDADKMFKLGARGYLVKDADTETLLMAVNTVFENEIYLNESTSKKLIKKIYRISNEPSLTYLKLSDKEIEFIKLLCTELTNKEIANNMGLSPRTIDGYSEALFEKLNVNSRIGIVLYAIRKEIVSIKV